MIPEREHLLCKNLDSREYEAGGSGYVQVEEHEANLISSKLVGSKLHSPVLDIDYQIRAVPSTTEGHFHLYLDGLQMSWWKYKILLRVLAFTGVIEPGYAGASIAQKGSHVRTPWTKKRVVETRGVSGWRAGKIRDEEGEWVDDEFTAYRESLVELADARSRLMDSGFASLAGEDAPPASLWGRIRSKGRG